jgi:perosamine synthetase
MATFFPVLYQGATPIPIDIEPDTWNIDPTQLTSKITGRTKAIVVVHIFGHPVDMDPVLEIAAKRGLYVIEDCAEAHGALYKGKPVGSLGTVGCFSFYSNKIITTGEGGMITTNDARLAARSASIKSLAFGKINKFMHEDVGYNYRLTNVQAAIGCAQMDKIERLIRMKRDLAGRYTERLRGTEQLQLPLEKDYAKNVYWMYHVVLRQNARIDRDTLLVMLADKGIETRPGFLPYNMQEIFIRRGMVREDDCPTANQVGRNSFYLPSTPTLADADVDYVCETLRSLLV